MSERKDQEPQIKRRRGERGNVFFTLFGAVAVVGVLGAGIMSTMRGPLSTMVDVNRRTQAESQMTIASKLAMLEASQGTNSGDCDLDGFVEPLEYGAALTGLTGGGEVPAAVGSSKVDPWGSTYGYCVWDAGTAVNDAGCGGSSQNRLAGKGTDDATYTMMAIISAGPNRTFETTCSEGPPALTKGGDDLVQQYDYSNAAAASGGLWSIKSGEPDTATIDKSIDVTGGAKFSDTVDLSGSSTAQLRLGAASMMLPTEDTLSDCSAANVNLLRINTVNDPDTLEICDDASDAGTGAFSWQSVAAGDENLGLWDRITDDRIYFDSAGTTQVGIGNTNPSEALDVTGNIQASADISAGGDLTAGLGKSVLWTGSTAAITESTGAIQINGSGGSAELTVASGIVGIGGSPVSGKTLLVQGGTTTSAENALEVRDSGATPVLVVRNDGRVGIGEASPSEALDVSGSADVADVYKIDGLTVLDTDTSTADTIRVGKAAANDITGDFNTIVGGSAGSALTSGTYNTVIGAATGATLTTGSNNILIGSAATAINVPAAGTSNYLNIGNSVFADLANKRVGIGQANNFNASTFDDALEVTGNVHATAALKGATLTISGNGDVDGVLESDDYTFNGVDFTPATCASGNFNRWTASGWVCDEDTGGGSGTGGAVTLADVLAAGNDGSSTQIKNIANPSADQDAATKKYVDDALVDGALQLVDGDNDTKIQVEETTDEDKIRFDTAGFERMIIDNTGKVGIGTTAPGSLLTIGAADGTSAGRLQINPQTTTTEGGEIVLVGGPSFAGSDLLLDNYAGRFRIVRTNPSAGEVFTVLQSGNAGFGTGTPASKLHVIGDLLLSNAATTCGATQKGALRLNTDSDELEMCDGAGAWNAYSSGGGGGGDGNADLNYDNVVLLTHLDADLSDSSRSAHTLTASGDAAVSATQAKFGGGSLAFDGTGDYVSIPDAASLEMGTGDFTIELWAYPTNVSANRRILTKESGGSGYSSYLIYMTGGNWQFYGSSSGSSWDIASGNSLGSATVNKWQHLAITRSGNTFYAFKDGVQQSTWTSSAAFWDNAGAFVLGRYELGADYYAGYLDDIRITKGAARYTEDFTPPSKAFPDGSFSQWVNNETGIYYNSGNVGIGTATQEFPLDVRGADHTRIQVSSANQKVKGLRLSTGGLARWDIVTDTVAEAGSNAGSDLYINRMSDAGTFINSAVMIDRSSGYVGIGTTNPTGILDVGGGGSILTTGHSTQSAALELGNARTGTGYSYIDLHGDTTYSDYGLRLIRGNSGADTHSDLTHRGTGGLYLTAQDAGFISFRTQSTNRMRITADGNVGIGNDAPAYPLDVTGDIGTSGMLSFAGQAGAEPISGSGVTQVWTLDDPDIYYTAGNVGIGTASPASELDVAGTIRTTEICDEAGANCHDVSGGWDSADNLGDHTATQALAMATYKITGMGDPSAAQDAATKAYVDTTAAAAADDLGNHTATQALAMATYKITGMGDPTLAQDAATKAYVDAEIASGGADDLGNHTATQALAMATYKITGMGNPSSAQDAATKAYVDAQITAGGADNLGNHTAANNIVLGSHWLSGDGGNEGVYVSSTGLVGIGTASPDQAFTVAGRIQSKVASPELWFYETDQTLPNGLWRMVGAGGSMTFQQNTAAGGDFSAATTRLIIDSTGNVGIGTGSPTDALDVAGDIAISGKDAFRGNDAWLRLNQDGEFTGGVYTPGLLRADGGLDVDGVQVISNNGQTHYLGNASQYLYANQTTTTYLNSNHSTITGLSLRDKESAVYGTLYGDGDAANFGLLDGDGNWSYLAAKDSYTAFLINNSEKMRILSTGNVGIGRTAPAAALDVNGVIRATSICDETGANCQDISGGWGVSDNLGNHTATANVQLGSYWLSGDGGNEGIKVDSTGLVGIGGTPTQKLTVAGGILEVRDGGDIMIRNSDNSWDWRIQQNSTQLDFASGDTPGTAKMSILANGNVGIGTASPTDKLYIASTVDGASGARVQNLSTGTSAYSTIYLGNSAASNDVTLFNVGSGNSAYGGARSGGIGTNSSTPFVFITGGTEKMRITNAGSVGVGVSPTYKFHVKGANTEEEAKFFDANGLVEIEGQNADATTFMSVYAQHGTNTTRGIFSVDSNTGASNARASHIFVRGDGNVGIGTATPAATLDVNGTIRAASICDEAGSNCTDISGGWAVADNLGNHTATANVQLGSYWLSGDGGSEGVFVKSDGNVGIGDSDPSHIFTVKRADYNAQMRLYSTKTGTTGGLYLGSRTAGISYILSGAEYVDVSGTATPYARNAAASGMLAAGATLQFFSNKGLTADATYSPTSRMTILPSGYVGIGTAAAGITTADMLHVAGGNGRFQGNTAGAKQVNLELGEMSDAIGAPLYQIKTDDATGDLLEFKSLRWASQFKLSRDSDNGEQSVMLVDSGDGGNYFDLYAGSTEDVVARIHTSGNSYLNGGKVGIGTASPTNKLTIEDSTATAGLYTTIVQGSNAPVHFGAADGAVITAAGSGSIGFYTGGLAGSDDNTAPDSGGASLKMVIANDGSVGIGEESPTVALDVVGDIHYTGRISDVSDRRLKTDIHPLNQRGAMMDKLGQIGTYTFRMKDDPKGEIEYGVMAQEVEKVFPELVATADDEMGSKSMNYVGLIAPMVEGMKELRAENAALRAQIDARDERLAALEQDMKGIKAHTGYGIAKAQMGLALLIGMALSLMMMGGIIVLIRKRVT